MESHRSLLSIKTATLLTCRFVEMVLRECPLGEHATNGVSESAMREVKRQTRILKFALEAHVGKIVKSHSTLKWIPTMSADANSFIRIGRDGLKAEMRRSGRAWKKLVAELGESVYKHAVYEKVPMKPVLEGDGEESHQDRLGGHEQGNVRVPEHKISMGREGIQHWTQARLVQRNITSGGSEARHFGGSIKQPEEDSALGE